MQDKNWETHIKSLAGALPIMLGDPRQLSESDMKKYRSYADWLQLMQNRYDIMSFRQDLPGFGEPAEGHWDGFQRINTNTKNGGIIAVFRHGALEKQRLVTIKHLNPGKTYQVKTMDGAVKTRKTGADLENAGFEIIIHEKYNGELFEITEVE
jgi:alpha-galactosidase